MADLDKEIAAIREEQQRLSTRISRSAIVRLFLLAVIVFTFARAVERVNHNVEIKTLRHSVSDSSIEVVELSNRLSSLERKLATANAEQLRTDGHPSPSTATDKNQITSLDGQQKVDVLKVEYLEVVTQLEKARDRFDKIDQDYQESLRREFTLQSSFLGTSLQFDLRFWVYVLPFLFLLTETYYQILRKKMRVLDNVATFRFGHQQEPTLVERLFISRESNKLTPFAKHPAQLEQVLYVVGNLLLTVYLIVLGWDYWPGLNDWELGQYSQLLLTISFYCGAYYQYVAGKLSSQAMALTEQNLEHGWILRFWMKIDCMCQYLLSRFLPPRISLFSASVFILISLYLSTAASSCRGPMPGYGLALSRADYWWLPALSVEYWRGIAQGIGRVIYLTSLVLAALTILFVLVSSKGRVYKSIRIRTSMFILTGGVTLFLILDFSFAVHWIPDILYPLKIIIWFITLSLWLRFGFSKSDEKRSRWLAIRAILIIVYVPFVIDACFLLGDAYQNRVFGIPVYFAAVCLLSLGYLKLMRPAHLMAEPTSSHQGAKPL